jgi:hypothetical protein
VDAGDLVCAQDGVGFGDCVGKVDGAGGVFDDDGFETECFAVDGGVANAKIVGQAAEEEALQVPLAEIASEAGWGGVVVFEEGGVAVDVAAEAFAEDEFGVGDEKRWVEGCSTGVLDDVLGPEDLGAVVDFDDLERLFVVGGGEGDVLVRVPVLGEDDVVESFGEGVDDGDYGIAVGDAEVSAGHEVVLDVDDQEGVCGLEGDHCRLWYHMYKAKPTSPWRIQKLRASGPALLRRSCHSVRGCRDCNGAGIVTLLWLKHSLRIRCCSDLH